MAPVTWIELPYVDLLFWVAVLVVLWVLGTAARKKIRAVLLQQEPIGTNLMAKFEEWHNRGGLSDAEFRTIKTTLAEQSQEELKDKDETG